MNRRMIFQRTGFLPVLFFASFWVQTCLIRSSVCGAIIFFIQIYSALN